MKKKNLCVICGRVVSPWPNHVPYLEPRWTRVKDVGKIWHHADCFKTMQALENKTAKQCIQSISDLKILRVYKKLSI